MRLAGWSVRAAVAAPLMALALAGCVIEDPVLPAPDNLCGASELQGLVGQPQSVLQTMRFAGPVRVIQPGMAVTMDYLAERLNFWIAEDGRIESVTCG